MRTLRPRLSLLTATAVVWKNRLPRRAWCPCLDPRATPDALQDLKDELAELLAVRPLRSDPSSALSSRQARRAALDDLLDELSDVSFALGRLAGSVLHLRYLPSPYARRHIVKIDQRMDDHGCVRSVRHLTNGRCPAERA